MRLAAMIQNRDKFLDSTRILLFHGTDSSQEKSFHQGIGIPESSDQDPVTDFGPGFYLTGFSWQAIRWARARADANGTQPILVTVQTTLKKLRRIDPVQKLIIDAYNESWASTIRKGRNRESLPYDWICGRCADRDVGTCNWTLSDVELVKALTPPEYQERHEFEQIWFGSVGSIQKCLTVSAIIKIE